MKPTSLTVEKQALPGVVLIIPEKYEDERGFFTEIFNVDVFKEIGISVSFTQDSLSYSKRNVLRGLHFQTGADAQTKLVRCVQGKIFDVVADVDPCSPTFGKYVSVELTAEKQNMLYVPGHYAHGFCVMSDEAYVEYKFDTVHNPQSADGVLYNDPLLSIEWPSTDPILSERDKNWKPLIREDVT